MAENSIATGRRKIDFDQSPYLVLWELTRACALQCKHCRAEAICKRDSSELTLEDIARTLDDLQQMGKLIIVLTGGDPAERPDLLEIIDEMRRREFTVAVTPSATPSMSFELVRSLKTHGVERLAVSLDGPNAASHDLSRGVPGSFSITENIVRWAHECSLPVQINTTISNFNKDRFREMADTVERFHAVLWSVFFLVPTGRASQSMQITAKESEHILQEMTSLAVTADMDIKSTAAPHFRRVLIQNLQEKREEYSPAQLAPHLRLGALRSYQSVNDGKGIMFISHTGDVYPSGFLPLSAGNVRIESATEIYRNSELFKELRNPALLTGKCGVCRYKAVCGGSRARAFAYYGDYLGEDPLCVYDER